MSEEKLAEVEVNTDPEKGPLDAAEANVIIAKTLFKKDGTFRQDMVKANIKASYELGVVSISIPKNNVMFSARIDEVMQVMFASAEAYKKMEKDEKK